MMKTSPEFQWINTDRDLAKLCEQLSRQVAIALDTEFVRSRTYYPHLGLLQIADDYGVYLIDPLAIKNTQPLADILTNPGIVKVLHSCSEDLEVFQSALGVLPASLFDTQIAAGFAGYGSSIGYAKLLHEIKGVDIPKQETRSNWLQRPLSDAQLNYAALDVVYLLEVYQSLVERLQQVHRVDWVESDSDAVVNKLRNMNHSDHYFKRIKMAWKLTPRQLAVLQVICRWREQQARSKDVPRSRIIKDSSLYDIALKLPKNLKQLQRVQDIHSRFVTSSGRVLLDLIEEVLDHDEELDAPYPKALPRPLSKQQTGILKLLKVKVGEIAQALELPQELLVRKKDYEALLRSKSQSGSYQLPSSLTDWRQEVVGAPLLHYAQSLPSSMASEG